MTLLQLFVIAVVQGLTEFLPISSSAHLILVPQLTGWQDQGLAIDIAVHVGTLFAVLIYFHRDVRLMLAGVVDLARGRWSAGGRLVTMLALATVPVVLVGLVFKLAGVQDALRSIEVIIVTTIGFGILLWVVDRRTPEVRDIGDFGMRAALLIGLAQALAPRLADDARVANLSSQLGSIGNLGRFGTPSYNISKAALNMATALLGKALGDRGIVVLALHPGWVQTDMGGEDAQIPPKDAVAGLLATIDGARRASSGGWSNFERKRPSTKSPPQSSSRE